MELIAKLLVEIIEDESIFLSINGDTNILEDLSMDSLQLINFLLRIEEEFDIEIVFDEFNMDILNTCE